MTCCAVGPCDDSLERGGKGCRLCDVVAKGKVTYRTAWQRGGTTVTMAATSHRDGATKGEAALTRKQARKNPPKKLI